jgi:predicted negative regulator of RcsB-dependent stress response
MNTTTTTQVPKAGTDVNDLVKNGDAGDFINENKGLVGIAVVVILAAIFGYGYYKKVSTAKSDNYANELYTYTTMAVENLSKDKVKAPEVLSGFEKVYKGKEGFATAGSYIVMLSDALVAKNNNNEAYSILNLGIQSISNREVLFFLNARASSVAEDLGKTKEALMHLESILKGSVMYMADKVYLDAGRLYLKLGNKEKAISSFKWVVDEGKEEEFKKMARLYLDELGA